jgi:prolipoprotein diacylglyceryltransferase
MKIAVLNPEIYFASFYILAFGVSLVIVIRYTVKQNIPLRSVLLMLTTVTLLTIIGSRLFTIPAGDWGKVISTGSLAGYTGRSAIGGLIFGIAGLVLSKRFLGLGIPVINIYSWIVPLGFGIQQIGCFFNGCCFGKPSDLPWSVQYPIGTNAHHFQWIQGMIDENAVFSLSVHPVQLYETIFLFLITYFVWRTRNIWKKEGSSLIFSMFLYLIIKFSVDFFRESALSDIATQTMLDIKPFQWFMLIAGIICGLVLLLYERFYKSRLDQRPLNTPSLKKSVTYAILLSMVIYLFRGLFTWFELIALDIIFIPAVLFISIHSLKSVSLIRIRLATSSFLALPLLLIFNSFPQDTTEQHQSIRSFYDNVKSYEKIDAGFSIGNFYGELRYNPHEGDCGTVYTTEDYKHEFRMGGIGYSRIKKEDNLTTTLGANLFAGVNRENNLTTLNEDSYFLFGVGPFIKYDYNWVGIGVGAQVGNLRWVPFLELDEDTYDSGTRFFPIMPELSLRVGRQDILDLRYNYGFTSPTAYPVITHEISIGSGFGIKPDFSFRFGAGINSYGTQQFLSLEGLVHKQLGLNLRYNFSSSLYMYENDTYYYSKWLQLGVDYRFGFKN